MEHFSVGSWVDFVRQVQGNKDEAEIVRHLERQCIECSSTAKIWGNIMRMAKQESSCEPPAWAVRAVKASFAVQKAIAPRPSPLEVASLLFDSALQPLALGVRGTASIMRQLLYKSGTLRIDMRMQPKLGSDSMVLMGQLLDATRPDQGMSGVPVSLLCKGDTVSQGTTNGAGEFDFGITAQSSLQVVFGLGGTRTIVVPVPNGADIA